MPGPVHESNFAIDAGTWRFTHADPSPELAQHIVEYWEVQGALSPFRETLLPNAATEVMFNLGPPHTLHADGRTTTWTTAWYSAFQERALAIESRERTHLVSARLHPLGAAPLLGRMAPYNSNNVIALDAILGEPTTRDVRHRLIEAADPAARFAILESLLTDLQRANAGDNVVPPVVTEAASRIEVAHGNIQIAELHEQLDVSRKHLVASFHRWLGVTPKAYAKIHRFIWTLAQLRQTEAVNWSSLATEPGYSDQSHLARDFRRIGAASPTQYLRQRTPDGAALLHDVG